MDRVWGGTEGEVLGDSWGQQPGHLEIPWRDAGFDGHRRKDGP